MRKKFSSWDEMQLLECDVCQNKRAERCRVRQKDKNDTRHAELPFSKAPYVVPYNMPKYFAQQLRALQFAQSAQPPQQLLWIVARDVPFLGSVKELRGAELAKRETQWLQKHDMATNGIMGFFPATLNEPVRFTATQSKDLRIFKNTRGILVNWELHAVDLALLQGEQAQEHILKQTPRKLYIQIPGATWKYSKTLPPGVYPLKPVFRPWHLDKAGNNRIRRFGFQLVPDFSGTAHSYVGYTLKAALADCLSWDTAPTRDHMLRSYCTMSRTCTADTLLVMQPFAPMLFRQGELPGPHLMMEYWHGRLSDENLQTAWKSAETEQEKGKYRLEDVRWPCSMCNVELDSTHYGVSLKEGLHLTKYWNRILAPGEWRLCMNCKGELRNRSKNDYYECKACHLDLPPTSFCAERLDTWRKHRNYEQMLCLQCTPLCERQWWEKRADKHHYTCSSCKKRLPRSAYNADGFADQKAIICMGCSRAEIVKKKNLHTKTFDCRGPCRRQKLQHNAFADAMLYNKNIKKWLCRECQYPRCDICTMVSDEAVPFGPEEQKEMESRKKYNKYRRRWICDWCLYPPCGGCGAKRTRATKRKAVHFHLWFCQECWGNNNTAANMKKKHPPCSDCGRQKESLEKRVRPYWEDPEEALSLSKEVHAHLSWRCGDCWRKKEQQH